MDAPSFSTFLTWAANHLTCISVGVLVAALFPLALSLYQAFVPTGVVAGSEAQESAGEYEVNSDFLRDAIW